MMNTGIHVHIISVHQSTDEGLAVTKTNTYAFILAVGTVDNIESAVVVCDQRVLTVANEMVLSAVLLLLGIHFVYNIEYNPVVREVFEFLQEKLLGIPLPSGKKTSVSYSNLYRSLNCIENKMSSDCDDVSDDEATQLCELV